MSRLIFLELITGTANTNYFDPMDFSCLYNFKSFFIFELKFILDIN